ncbi:hypothetical protein PYW08_001533 [Mythimna loreyi]|uniref:Uncharacterized protein n=1 Tax=Mythimna loreyi TaxID=667449 RepID=A0ACC2R492_9NEOP|nr:hypothetical protein PYW08_001533 [Mythimna loreyi]
MRVCHVRKNILSKEQLAIAMKIILILFFAFTFGKKDTCAYSDNVLPLSCDQIRELVDGHNSRRLRVAQGKVAGQPAAKEMKMMVWDEEIAAKASKWAEKHEFNHNPDTNLQSSRFTTGENLYWYSTTDSTAVPELDLVIESWFQEHANYTFGPLKPSDFKTNYHIGHYTQVVWFNSTYLGCAVSKKNKFKWYEFIVVCNYGPPGNYIGEKPYEEYNGNSTQLVCDQSECDHPYGLKC